MLMSLLMFAACGKEQCGDESLSAVFRVGAAAGTKASADASRINRYIMEVYSESGDVFYDRIEKVVPDGTLETTMEVSLHVGIGYNFIFWADCSDGGKDIFYETCSKGDHGLRAVSIKENYSGNDDRRDAFCASLRMAAHKAFEEKIILRRPFARICVMTDDLDRLPTDYVKPTGISVRFTACSCIDLMTGELSSEREFSYSAVPYCSTDPEPFIAGYSTMSMDYVLASAERSIIPSMEFTSTFAAGSCTRTFTNFGYQRNHKTNIMGSILTEDASYDIILSPDFDSDNLE